jgi:hypothetical protein
MDANFTGSSPRRISRIIDAADDAVVIGLGVLARDDPYKRQPTFLPESKLRSTDAFSGLSVFTQVGALIGAIDGCIW